MRVQDLLLTALFLEGITEGLVVIRGRVYVFTGVAAGLRFRSVVPISWFPVCDDAYKASLFS